MGAPSLPGFRSDHNFFGFNPKDRVAMHDNLFNLLWHGEGRWHWNDIYYMPVHIRTHWTRRINKILKEREEYAESVLQAQQNAKRKSNRR
jgi:hypothetical protein